MTTINNQYTASAPYAGGWRSADREDLAELYELDGAAADAICQELRRLEEVEEESV